MPRAAQAAALRIAYSTGESAFNIAPGRSRRGALAPRRQNRYRRGFGEPAPNIAPGPEPANATRAQAAALRIAYSTGESASNMAPGRRRRGALAPRAAKPDIVAASGTKVLILRRARAGVTRFAGRTSAPVTPAIAGNSICTLSSQTKVRGPRPSSNPGSFNVLFIARLLRKPKPAPTFQLTPVFLMSSSPPAKCIAVSCPHSRGAAAFLRT